MLKYIDATGKLPGPGAANPANVEAPAGAAPSLSKALSNPQSVPHFDGHLALKGFRSLAKGDRQRWHRVGLDFNFD